MVISRARVLQMALFRSFFMAESYSTACVYVYVCIHCVFFTYSAVDGHLSCFHILATLNTAAVNIVAGGGWCMCLFDLKVFVFSEDMPRSAIAGSHGGAFSKVF